MTEQEKKEKLVKAYKRYFADENFCYLLAEIAMRELGVTE